MFKKLLLSLIAAVPIVAQAQWIEIDKGSEFTMYVDPDRTVATAESLKHAEAWFKMVVHTDLTKDGLSVGDHRLMKYKFKCTTNELAIAAAYDYKKGSVLNSYLPQYPNFKPAIPESIGEFMTLAVCGYLYSEDNPEVY